jgi:hypothetical protein
VSVIIIGIVTMIVVGVGILVLLQVLIAGAIGDATVTGIEIEMTTDAGILADLLRREANTILEDIDMTYHPNQTLFTDSLFKDILDPLPACPRAFLPVLEPSLPVLEFFLLDTLC